LSGDCLGCILGRDFLGDMGMTEKVTEIRRYDGELDEIVSSEVKFFHLEQMYSNHWWLRLDLTNGKSITVDFTANKGSVIKANVEEGQ